MKQRGLALNKDKSVCVIVGSKRQRAKTHDQIEKELLVCGDLETKQKEEEMWLGQILSGLGLADCVENLSYSRYMSRFLSKFTI